MDTRYYIVKRLDDTHLKVTEHGKFGIVDSDDMILVPIRYDEIKERTDGNYNVCINNRWGIISIDGNEIVSVYYNAPIQFNEKGYAIVQNAEDLSYGLIRIDGFVIIPAKYRMIKEAKFDTYFEHDEFNDPLFFVYQTLKGTDWYDDKDYRIGVCNINGEFIVPIKYEEIKIEETFLMAERKGYYDLYDGINNRGLLIGGFHQFYIRDNRLFFYFGGRYSSYTDKHDKDHTIFVAWGGVWIITDFEITSILRDDNGVCRNLKGKIYDISTHDSNSLEKIYNTFPKCMTFVENSEWPHFIDSYILVRGSFTDYYIINDETGEKSDTYHEIKETEVKNVFFVEKSYGEESSGILQDTRLVIPTIYMAFTKPVNGYSFGARKQRKDTYCIELINLNNLADIVIAYQDLSYSEVQCLFWNKNLYIYPLKEMEGLKAIRIKRTGKLSKDFCSLISSEEIISEDKYLNDYSWKDEYWFPEHYYMREENKEEQETDDSYSDTDVSMWTDKELRDAADIAYEGYSRLYLGLED